MRYLVISDLHANWEALCAVMTDAQNAFDAILCLGDLVGYGPDPNAVVDWVRENVELVIRGNHDRACCALVETETFNEVAQTSTRWTLSEMTEENRNWLAALQHGPLMVKGFDIVHGAPDDEDRYLFHVHDAEVGFSASQSPVTFFGHTHVQGGFIKEGREVFRIDRVPESLLLEYGKRYLLNPGSVGQPRDGDNRAAYALFDDLSTAVEYRRVPYDISATQVKILQFGLSETLARRLAEGR